MRREFDPYLSFRVWVETSREVRLRRGLARDGLSMKPRWDRWMAAEDDYVRGRQPRQRADAIISDEE